MNDENRRWMSREFTDAMEIIEVSGVPPVNTDRMVLAIGKFDGVHIGHKKILEAAKIGLGRATLAVMSIWPHPAHVLGGQAGYGQALTPFAEKCRQLSAEGVDKLYAVRFSASYAETTAEAFVYDHLSRLQLHGIVVGQDFRFGKGGSGDARALLWLCNDIGVPVTVVKPVEENGVKVSSSQIRKHLEYGRVEAAEVLLGRPYAVQGIVVHGDGRGRQLGFPTANLQLEDEYVLPAAGVYAASVAISDDATDTDSHWFGVLNAGVRPTVDGKEFRIEVHLLDFAGDLYGKTLRVSFLRRVRDERKFDGLPALQRQIDLDVRQVREVFQGR